MCVVIVSADNALRSPLFVVVVFVVVVLVIMVVVVVDIIAIGLIKFPANHRRILASAKKGRTTPSCLDV